MSTLRWLPGLIRADAGQAMGTGHLMRCLALAQGWQAQGGTVLLLSACAQERLRRRVAEAGVPAEWWETAPAIGEDLQRILQTLERMRSAQSQCPWLVLDGERFSEVFQGAAKAAGYRVLVIDDMGALARYEADVILNQNVFADAVAYECNSSTLVLRGPRYALLAPAFAARRDEARQIPGMACRVLVTMGGSDPDNATAHVLEALRTLRVRDLEVVIAVGAYYAHGEMLQAAARTAPFPVRVIRDATDMPRLMAWADIALSAAGTTCWELACLGVPMVLLVIADNQRGNAEALAAREAAVHAGEAQQRSPDRLSAVLRELMADPDRRRDMSLHARQLVDGKGAARVLACVQGLSLSLRHVQPDDCRLLWEWANDPDVRAVSFSPEAIPWERHLEWFERVMRNHHTRCFIATTEGDIPVGQVRYDCQGTAATLSLSIDRRFRGQRFGQALVWRSAMEVFREGGVEELHAYVRPGNAASTRIFLQTGFREMGATVVRGHTATHWRLIKDELGR